MKLLISNIIISIFFFVFEIFVGFSMFCSKLIEIIQNLPKLIDAQCVSDKLSKIKIACQFETGPNPH